MNARCYIDAIAYGLLDLMESDQRVFLMGEGVDGIKGIYGTTLPAFQKFGRNRVIDTPLSENAITGIATGAAMYGYRPILFHQRNDFLMLTCDQLVNHAAKIRYVTNGKFEVPLTIITFISNKLGEGAQHSQSLQALFAHIPGLKVVMPASASDAGECLKKANKSPDPTIIFYHRDLFQTKDILYEDNSIPGIGARTVRFGNDTTIVAVSKGVHTALEAAIKLSIGFMEAEVIDLVSVRPWDEDRVFESVKKTGRLAVVDTGWKSFGISAEIVARVTENCFSYLKSKPVRIALPETPAPASPHLLERYQPTAEMVAAEVFAAK